MALGCKPSDESLRRFESFLSTIIAGIAQLARASAFQAEGRGFEPVPAPVIKAQVAQSVEHLLGKEEVIGSSPILSSI